MLNWSNNFFKFNLKFVVNRANNIVNLEINKIILLYLHSDKST